MQHRKSSKSFNKVVAKDDELQQFFYNKISREKKGNMTLDAFDALMAIQGVINEV
jgi:hypothetical protein